MRFVHLILSSLALVTCLDPTKHVPELTNKVDFQVHFLQKSDSNHKKCNNQDTTTVKYQGEFMDGRIFDK